MKAFLAAAALFIAPIVANAACAPTDFAIKDFKPGVTNARMSLAGELVNNCSEASAAQIKIDIKDASGNVVQTKQAWPAGTTNIAPGETVKFDLGRMFRYQSSMESFTASVVDVRSW